MVKHWVEKYPGLDPDQVVAEVTDVVQCEMYQAVAEAIIGIRSLKGSLLWTGDDLEAACSPEALTAATMVRFHVLTVIRRSLGSRLGKIKDAA